MRKSRISFLSRSLHLLFNMCPPLSLKVSTRHFLTSLSCPCIFLGRLPHPGKDPPPAPGWVLPYPFRSRKKFEQCLYFSFSPLFLSLPGPSLQGPHDFSWGRGGGVRRTPRDFKRSLILPPGFEGNQITVFPPVIPVIRSQIWMGLTPSVALPPTPSGACTLVAVAFGKLCRVQGFF